MSKRFEEAAERELQYLRGRQVEVEKLRGKLITPEAWDAYHEMAADYQNGSGGVSVHSSAGEWIGDSPAHKRDAVVLREIKPILYETAIRSAKLIELQERDMSRDINTSLKRDAAIGYIVFGVIVCFVFGLPTWYFLGGFWATCVVVLFAYLTIQAIVENAKQVDNSAPVSAGTAGPSRNISQATKISVATRDGGRCVRCGSTEDLQYDHVTPFSRGGGPALRISSSYVDRATERRATAGAGSLLDSLPRIPQRGKAGPPFEGALVMRL